MHAVGILIAAAALVPQHATATVVGRLIQRAEPIYCAGSAGRSFALTFDDGPGPYTPRLVAVLRRERARATFFVVGSRVALFPRSIQVARRVGVFGNHTWSHPHLRELSRHDVRRELAQAEAAIAAATGPRPRLFRPPFAEAEPADDRLARRLDLLDVRWSVDGGDAVPGATPARVARAVTAGLGPGAIVLLHDAHPWTARVVERVLATARARGLTSVTVPDLLELQPPTRAQLAATGGARCPHG